MGYLKVKGVNFILLRNDGKILIEKRDNKALIAPNEYCIPGGAIEPGESPDQAIIRVVAKETGIQVNRFRFSFFCGFEYKINKKRNLNLFYVIKIDEPVVSSSGELIWCDCEEIDELNLVYNENEIIKAIKILF